MGQIWLWIEYLSTPSLTHSSSYPNALYPFKTSLGWTSFVTCLDLVPWLWNFDRSWSLFEFSFKSPLDPAPRQPSPIHHTCWFFWLDIPSLQDPRAPLDLKNNHPHPQPLPSPLIHSLTLPKLAVRCPKPLPHIITFIVKNVPSVLKVNQASIVKVIISIFGNALMSALSLSIPKRFHFKSMGQYVINQSSDVLIIRVDFILWLDEIMDQVGYPMGLCPQSSHGPSFDIGPQFI